MIGRSPGDVASDASQAASGRDTARRLGRSLVALGHLDPVLVVADNASIAAFAPAWAESFDEVGWLHRVRLFTAGRASDGHLAIVDEARTLGARSIVAAGDEAVVAAASAAAAALGLAFLASPAASTSSHL